MSDVHLYPSDLLLQQQARARELELLAASRTQTESQTNRPQYEYLLLVFTESWTSFHYKTSTGQRLLCTHLDKESS
jgi:hypothetical protein